MDARLWMMNRTEVCKTLGTSSSGLHRGIIDGRYPRPYRTSDKSVRWRSDEILAVIANFPIAVPVEVAPGVRKGRKRTDESRGGLP